MGVIETIILGLIQGLTEFIPVSSSGHLVIAQLFFSGASEHLFLEWISLGTLLSLVVYFRHRLVGIAVDIVVRRNYKLARNVVLTSIPAGVVGLAFGNFIESSIFFGSFLTVVVAMGVIGIVMIVVDKLPTKSSIRSGDDLTWKRALMIGVIQVTALVPGVSRSGSTIIAGRLMGLGSAAAAEYSFLVSIPIMSGLMLRLVVSSEGRQYFIDNAQMLVVGNLVAFVSGLWAVSFLIRFLSRHGLAVFGWYRVILASVLSAGLLLQLIKL
ncbi:undecaprenyl-diphosphate phosphatase [Candidatus Saccharibacteria bacterium]|nr:undecaprenyl-diphosphate phosphatase [Candidatus Saccharibacteria bacterium]